MPIYDLVGGFVGLVVGARLGALREGMHFSQSKNALLLNLFYLKLPLLSEQFLLNVVS